MLEIVHLGTVLARDDARIFAKQCRAMAARGKQADSIP